MDKNTLLNISKNMQDLTFILAKKNYDKIGALSNVDQNTVVYKKTMHGLELSFDVYKELNGVQEKLWNELTDFKLVWLKETNEYFQITVSTDEIFYTKKTITATSLCEAELSQVNLYNIEINTEDDIARDDYKITTFYNKNDPESSLIHRILSKVPQYTIKHVDSSLSKIQRSFSVDGTSILDFLNGDCAEQFNCLFTFDSADRSVSVYDLYTVCVDCGERDDMNNFTHIDENGSLTYTCPKCGSHNVKYYGEDTKIFVDNENLTDEVQLETDTDSVKNCFKLVAGDDLMNATIQLLNMNGSDYIYYISDEQKKDMPKELVDKIESYDKLCVSYSAEYEALVSQIYEASNKLYYYKNTMMPTIEHATVTAATEAAKLTAQNLSPLGLSSVSTSTSKATVESALKNYAKVYVKSGYVKLEINDSSFSYVGIDSLGNHYGTWTGNFKVTNYSDKDDIAYSSTISVKVYDNYQDFIEQKVKKAILNDTDDDNFIFDVLSIEELSDFKEALTYYCLERLKSFYDAIQSALDVLVQMDQATPSADMYLSIYVPYYNKLQACQSEIDKRQATINMWQTKYDNAVSNQQEIQKILNFEEYIGKDFYKLFCCYRREDVYQNDNYISDGLEDQEVIERAKEFLEVAKKELVKSSTMQHSISTTLYNLLCIPEFKPILNSFEVGNWIRVRVDGNIYKLRLIQYEISFSNMNTISVEFSDVTKIRDSLTDFQSLVKDTQSMSSSYSYISKQADVGQKASESMNDVLQNGLNSALVSIKNNDKEEVTYDKHGILCREYDDISDSYSDEQLIITHNILGYTDDNMKSVKASLGKHEYVYYNGSTFVKDIAYGLSCEFVQSGYIYGSQIISGDIYSSNYSSTAGSHINLKDGSFSFAGGKFSYDSKSNNMILKGVTIKWDSSTPPKITDIDGLNEQLSGIDGYLNQLDGRIQSFSQTTDPSTNWTTASLKEQHIGDLWFNPSNGLTKRWTGSSWETITDSILESLAKSKAQVFTTKPTVAYFKGDMLIPVETFTVSGVTYNQEKAYRALKDSNGTTFNNSDWDALDYTNDDAVNAFINGDYKRALENINTQIDGKADTFYQSTKPHTEYTNIASNSTYNLYVGDLWYDTSTGKSYMYNKVTNGANYNYIWQQMDIPDEVYDKIDGIASIYVTIPSNPNVGDLLIPTSDITSGGKTYKSKKVYRYDGSSWAEIKYTDDSALTNFMNGEYKTTIADLQSQADKKAETWYQSTDPSTAWTTTGLKTEHKGDLWYNTSDENTYIYNGSAWKKTKTTPPQSVFDRIDGKAQIFTSQPTPPYDIGDLWVQGSSGDILHCKTKRTSGSYNASDWTKSSKYTDDSALNKYKEDIKDFQGKVNKALTGSTNEIGEDYIISPKIGGGYLYIANNNYSVEIDPNHSGSNTLNGYLFCIKKISDNSRIMSVDTGGNGYFSGEINSLSGNIGGWTIDSDGISNTWIDSNKTYTVQLNSIISDTTPVLYIEKNGESPFFVRANGFVYAKNISITGGQVGGWIVESNCLRTDNGKIKLLNDGTISGSTISGGNININDVFKVESNGDLFANGAIALCGFNIETNGETTYLNCYNSNGGTSHNAVINASGTQCVNQIMISGTNTTGSIELIVSGDSYDSKVTLNSSGMTVTGATTLNANAKTHALVPAANATYALGEGGSKGWSNIYIGNASNTYNGLRIINGTTNYNLCGIGSSNVMIFGDPSWAPYIYVKNTSTPTSGAVQAFTIGDNGSTTLNDSHVWLFGRNDADSRYIGSYLVYARNYGSASNVVVTSNGVLGRSTSSSKRYKHDIREFSVDEVSCLYDLPLKKFKYNNDYISKDDEYYDKDLYGFIVEDLDKVLPISVQHNLDDDAEYTIPEMWNNNIIVPCLLKLIQDLNNRLKKVEEK